MSFLPTSSAELTLSFVTFIAAMVNGAIGYGFSTLTVPIALLYFPSRILSPGLVLAEVALNLMAVVMNRHALRIVWRRVLPMMIASLPGIGLGVWVLKSANSDGLRFATFCVLLPLVLLQAAGFRRPLKQGSLVELPVGFGIGVLYSTTTISGPPLGLLFNNQGLAKDEFRAALSLFRVTESTVTAIAYYFLAVYTPQSTSLSLYILPCILVGIPLGRLLVRSLEAETFRRVCMTFDAWLISFSISRLLSAQHVAAPIAYLPMLAVIVIDIFLLQSYFSKRRHG